LQQPSEQHAFAVLASDFVQHASAFAVSATDLVQQASAFALVEDREQEDGSHPIAMQQRMHSGQQPSSAHQARHSGQQSVQHVTALALCCTGSPGSGATVGRALLNAPANATAAINSTMADAELIKSLVRMIPPKS
jgi:hypothetical protein